MFKLEGSRGVAKFYQENLTWEKANEISKWLAAQGFSVEIIKV